MLWILFGSLLLLAVFAIGWLALWIVGIRAPRETSSVASCMVGGSPEAVCAMVANLPGHASWFPGMDRVETYPTTGPHTSALFHFAWTVLRVEIDSPNPRQLRWSFADERGHVRGEWEFNFDGRQGGTLVTLHERRTIDSPLARGWLAVWLRQDHYIRKYLDALAGRCSASA